MVELHCDLSALWFCCRRLEHGCSLERNYNSWNVVLVAGWSIFIVERHIAVVAQ